MHSGGENSGKWPTLSGKHHLRLTVNAGLLTLLVLTGCSLTARDSATPIDRSGELAARDSGRSRNINIEQIDRTQSALDTQQIPSDQPARNLTVAQLRAYQDRCAPDAGSPPPPNLNCEELRLRIERTFRSDDEVANALATLDRLTAPETSDLLSRLENGDLRGLDAQAVASGTISPESGQPSPEDDPDAAKLQELEAALGAIAIIPPQ